MEELEKEFVLYPEALGLKEIGFDEPCICAFYQDGQTTDPFPTFVIIKDVTNSKIAFGTIKCTRPTYSQAFRWFREKHKLTHQIQIGEEMRYATLLYESRPKIAYNFSPNDKFYVGSYSTYEEAEIACMKQLIEIVKNKNT